MVFSDVTHYLEHTFGVGGYSTLHVTFYTTANAASTSLPEVYLCLFYLVDAGLEMALKK